MTLLAQKRRKSGARPREAGACILHLPLTLCRHAATHGDDLLTSHPEIVSMKIEDLMHLLILPPANNNSTSLLWFSA
jgi:hypothetical protein